VQFSAGPAVDAENGRAAPDVDVSLAQGIMHGGEPELAKDDVPVACLSIADQHKIVARETRQLLVAQPRRSGPHRRLVVDLPGAARVLDRVFDRLCDLVKSLFGVLAGDVGAIKNDLFFRS